MGIGEKYSNYCPNGHRFPYWEYKEYLFLVRKLKMKEILNGIKTSNNIDKKG